MRKIISCRLAVGLLCCSAAILLMMSSCFGPSSEDTLLMTSESADGAYKLEAYRTNPDATVDYSVRVYLISDTSNRRRYKRIYDAYHMSKVEIEWESNSIVVINGRALDLSQGETYDWRNELK